MRYDGLWWVIVSSGRCAALIFRYAASSRRMWSVATFAPPPTRASLCATALATERRDVYELGHVKADLVVLTVLPEEYAAVLACLHEPKPVRGSMTTPNNLAWRLGTIVSHYDAPFKVVVGMATATPAFSALATSQA